MAGSAGRGRSQSDGGLIAESVFGSDDRVRVSDTAAEPWRSIGKVTVTAEAGTFSATGFLVGPYHMLTAGHVVHDPAYGGDGWVEGLTVAFGKDGAIEPFGRARAVDFRAPDAWVADGETVADWALVTLDRSVGAHLGAFELAAHPDPGFYDGAFVTLAGYPGDLSGGRALYAAAGAIEDATAERLFYAGTLDTAGGQSGGPVWRSFSSTGRREAIGLHATGVVDPDAPGAANGATRFTEARLTLIEEWIAEDAIAAPPVDRPDLADADAVTGTGTAAISATTVAAGGTLSLTLHPRNLGTAESGTYAITVHASANDEITPVDVVLGEVEAPALAPFETGEVSVPLEVPAAMPGGSYRIGWVLDSGDALAEFDETDNTALLPLSVSVTAMPDLMAEAVSPEDTGWRPGEEIAVSWRIVNLGGAAAAPVASALRLSADPEITAADRLLLRDDSGTLLGPGREAVAGAPLAFTVPADLAPGDYFIGAIADPDGALDEADETNNLSAALRVTVSLPGVLLAGTDGANGIAGGSGDDTLLGYRGDDTLAGGSGADSLDGGGDDDALYAETGPDTVLGGFGFDTLFGNEGADSLAGDLGDGGTGQGDVLNGGSGADTLAGEGGPDSLYGGAGDDDIRGGQGVDIAFAGPGDDRLAGGTEGDRLDGEAGDDLVEGGAGEDVVAGGPGRDTLRGGEGPDFVDAGPDADLVEGGPGDDIVLARSGADTVLGGAGIDRVQGGSGGDSLLGGDGDDRLFGQDGVDTLGGGSGDDLLFGNAGDDSVEGGPGGDSLVGEGGRDTLLGGAGDDVLAGREGDDSLDGGAGADIVDGEAGDDAVSGGEGADALHGRAGRDTLSGGAGADFLAGGADADTVAGGPGPDRIAGDDGADHFVFAPGDGADHLFDLVPGEDVLRIEGGAGSFGELVQGTSAEGWLTLGYAADPGDVITLQGIAPGELADDGTVVFA